MNFINNWLREITLAAAVTECPLDLPDGTYRLVLAEGVGAAATRIEVISADVYEGIAELQRGLEGTDDQAWGEGSIINCSLTAGVLADVYQQLADLAASIPPPGGGGLTKDDFYTLVPQGYYGTGADVDGGSLQLFNRKELGCVFYGGLPGYVGIAPVYRVGVGPDIVWGEFDYWSLGAARCAHVFTVVDTGVSPHIGIAPPPGVFGSLRLSAPAFGPMYNEPPATDFEFSLVLLVPALVAGDVMNVSVGIPGFNTLELAMNPVTREWTCGGVSIGTQGEYLTELVISAGDPGPGGYPETALVIFDYTAVPVPLSADVYSAATDLVITARAASTSVFRLGRIGARVTYPDYS